MGTVQTGYTYEPFGKTSVTGQNSSNSFQYTGRENDGMGFYYYRARYYGPTMSRFLSEDPLYSPMYNAMKCRGSFAPSVSRLVDVGDLAPLMRHGFKEAVSAFSINPQHISLYIYTEDNPINKIDPNGLRAGNQPPGCDWFPDFNPCATKCCDVHDKCFKDASDWCDVTTWVLPANNPTRYSQCDFCNTVVAHCLWKAATSSGTGKSGGCP